MDFTQNYFDLLGSPRQYEVSLPQISDHYRDLQKQFHPDKFASKSAAEQRAAVQFAAYINTAYQTLKSPVLRAEYLLQLVDEVIDHQNSTISDGAFLMLQMQWRESLGDISMIDDNNLAEENIDALRGEVKKQGATLQNDFNLQYEQQCYKDAKATVAKLHFVEKMQQEIETIESSLFD